MKDEVGNLGRAGRTTSDLVLVVQEDGNDLSKTQRHDRQIVTTKSQRRDAEQDTRHHRQRNCDRNRPERVQVDAERWGGGQGTGHPGRRVGTDGVERHESQVEKPGESDDDVET